MKEKEEDDSFLALSIVSTINIEKTRFDMNGFYQCIAVHQEIHAQQTFNVHVNINGKSKTKKKLFLIFVSSNREE